MRQQQQGRGVVIIGQAGAGKSALVNMLCPEANAPSTNNALPCTMAPQSYTCDLGGGRHCTVHDTPGIPQGGGWPSFLKFLSKTPKETVELRKYLKKLKDRGELHLLVYCMSSYRCLKKSSQWENYKDFKSFVGDSVPVVVVVTGLEDGRSQWWSNNARALQKFDEGRDYRACVTTLSDSSEYNGSLEDVRRLIWSRLRS